MINFTLNVLTDDLEQVLCFCCCEHVLTHVYTLWHKMLKMLPEISANSVKKFLRRRFFGKLSESRDWTLVTLNDFGHKICFMKFNIMQHIKVFHFLLKLSRFCKNGESANRTQSCFESTWKSFHFEKKGF